MFNEFTRSVICGVLSSCDRHYNINQFVMQPVHVWVRNLVSRAYAQILPYNIIYISIYIYFIYLSVIFPGNRNKWFYHLGFTSTLCLRKFVKIIYQLRLLFFNLNLHCLNMLCSTRYTCRHNITESDAFVLL